MTSIIAILGDANTGKTTTLWMVYTYLVRCASSVRFFLNCKDRGYVEMAVAPNKILCNEKHKTIDFRTVLTIRQNVYVITSKGDDEKSIRENLNWALRFTPTAIICASRTKGAARQELEKYLKIFPSLLLTTKINTDKTPQETMEDRERKNTKKITDLVFDRTKKNVESKEELDKESVDFCVYDRDKNTSEPSFRTIPIIPPKNN